MNTIIELLCENKVYIFSGIGTSVVSGVLAIIYRLVSARRKHNNTPINNTVNVNIENNSAQYYDNGGTAKDLSEAKLNTRILFIDDEKFRTVDNLKRAGWVHTKRVNDVHSVDDPCILESNILFVDIQGVGVKAGFTDEGLGLASAIKDKYPQKRVIIYSAETKGERFHESLRKADDFLKKNADAYQFQQIIEKYALHDNDE